MSKQRSGAGTTKSDWHLHVIPFGLLLAIQLALVFLREQPLILADEAGYLANAGYLSGAAHMPTFYGSHSYPFGYSLFLIPVYWLFDNPYSVYKASLGIGVLLMSTLYVSLYYVLTHLLGNSPRLAMLAAFITCLFPPLLLRSNFAWAETAYVPGFMLLVALFGTLLRYKTVTVALVFGLHLGFMYTIHSRSLPLIPIALIYLITLACLRALSWKAVGYAISGTALMFVTTRVVVEHLRTAGSAEVLEIPIRPVVSHLLSLQGWYDLPLKINEQVLYLAQSSFGLFPLGVLAIGLYLWQCRRTGASGLLCNAPSGTLIFFLLAWIATLVFTSAFLGSIKDEAQFLIGRFIDGISGLCFALGLITILRGKQWWSRRLGTVSIALLAGSTLVAIYSLPVLLPNAFEPGVFHYFALLGSTWRALIVASVVAAVGFVFFSLARGRWRFVAVAAIVCLFLLTSAFGYFFAILPLQDRVARSSTLASYIRAYLGSPPTIAYDTTYYHPLTYFTYEYLLPHTRFIPFDGAAGELPPAPIVISSRFWKDADTLNAHFWQAEPHVPLVGADQALWTLPGPAQSALLPHLDYANSVLGLHALPAWSIVTRQGIAVQPTWGLRQHGLFLPTDHSDTIPPVRFTSLASFHVPTADHPPQALLLNLISTVNQDTPLRVQVNDHTLFANSIPPGNWCHLFPLPSSPNASLTHVQLSLPQAGSDTNQQPPLMVVRGITVLDHVPAQHLALTADPLPPSAYRSRLTLLSPPYPQPIVRGAMASLRLTVTNTGDHTWPTPCEIGQTPAAVQLGILWFPSHSTNRDLSSHVAEGRTALPYALAPGSSISLTAILAPFTQAGDPLPPGEYEVWIGPVQEGLAWFFQEGDDVLKAPVTVVH